MVKIFKKCLKRLIPMSYFNFLPYFPEKSREYDKSWLSLGLSREKPKVSQNLWRRSKSRRFSCKSNVQFWLSLGTFTVDNKPKPELAHKIGSRTKSE